ncbi:MAG: hypothetical protein EA361_05350 [Bacteroidetes bacterium]|nr:MAG: hypothetical protein EA361_05350 [Bacteroidota bacterium]
MNSTEPASFPGKILLLGEYSIILGGEAITVPLERFSGSFEYPANNTDAPDFARQSNQAIREFLGYLQSPEIRNVMSYPLDLDLLEKETTNGLFFSSTIPQGYGAGSSGALVAALFSRFANPKPDIASLHEPDTLRTLRTQLSRMESFFHGSSSGLDPLTSLLRKTLHVQASGKINFPDLSGFFQQTHTRVFLLDTGITGNTKPLVEGFRQQLATQQLNGELLKGLNNEVVHALLNRDPIYFSDFLAQLSLFQLENMKPMIPEPVSPIWRKGLETGQWTLKLCGSGGGGYVLGFAPETTDIEAVMQAEGMKLLALEV